MKKVIILQILIFGFAHQGIARCELSQYNQVNRLEIQFLEEGDYQTIKGFCWKGVIFPADYYLGFPKESRFTPTSEEIRVFEKKLRKKIKTLNKYRTNQGFDMGPIVHRNLPSYFRQYIGLINEFGERIIFVHFLWRWSWSRIIFTYSSPIDGWKNEWKTVNDGGSKYWRISFNLNTRLLFDFSVNGIA